MNDRPASPDPDRYEDVRELVARTTPERAWRAWADPEIIAGWFADRAEGNPVPGGQLVHVFESFGEARYEVVEAEPGERLVLRGHLHGTDFEQRIEVEPEGDQTRIRLIHSGFDASAELGEEFKGIDSGWKLALAILRHYLEHHFGRSKQSLFRMRPAPFDFDTHAALFREPEGLDRWLTKTSRPIRSGQPVELELWDGRPLDGSVLADSGREIALTWPEIDGTLELKAFAMGPAGPAIGLRAITWSSDGTKAAGLGPWLDTTLDRLAKVVGPPGP